MLKVQAPRLLKDTPQARSSSATTIISNNQVHSLLRSTPLITVIDKLTLLPPRSTVNHADMNNDPAKTTANLQVAALRLKLESVPKDGQIAPKGNVLIRLKTNVFDTILSKSLRASSAHLTLKSRVFRAMLEGYGFEETKQLQEQHCVELQLPEDDCAAFTIVMNVVHGNFFRVPKVVELSMLLKIATLVDKYEWHEAVEGSASHWIQNLRSSFPKKMTPSVLSWLWLSCLWASRGFPKANQARRTAKHRLRPKPAFKPPHAQLHH